VIIRNRWRDRRRGVVSKGADSLVRRVVRGEIGDEEAGEKAGSHDDQRCKDMKPEELHASA
jgi:hypothetical protein